MNSATLTQETVVTVKAVSAIGSSELCSRDTREPAFHSLRLDWELVSDATGDSRPRMHWLVE